MFFIYILEKFAIVIAMKNLLFVEDAFETGEMSQGGGTKTTCTLTPNNGYLVVLLHGIYT